MFQNRFASVQFRNLTLAAALALGAGTALIAPIDNAAAGDVDCSKLKNATVKKVCGKGGSALKKAMKKAEKAYEKKYGKDVKCTTCHKTSNGGDLKADAVKEHWDGKMEALFTE